jgi:hypothetical protein
MYIHVEVSYLLLHACNFKVHEVNLIEYVALWWQTALISFTILLINFLINLSYLWLTCVIIRFVGWRRPAACQQQMTIVSIYSGRKKSIMTLRIVSSKLHGGKPYITCNWDGSWSNAWIWFWVFGIFCAYVKGRRKQ